MFRADGLLVGCALAVLIPRLPRPGTPLQIASGVMLLVFCSSSMRSTFLAWGATAVAVAAAVLVAGQSTGGTRRPIRPLVTVGKISYGLYLFHVPILALLRISGGLSGWWLTIAAAITSFAVAWLSYSCVERRWVRRGPRPDSLTPSSGDDPARIDRTVPLPAVAPG
jgi:peptidoglycan/LPS O-acetylase OafA/YrhL